MVGMDFSADGRLLALSVGEVVMIYDVAAQHPWQPSTAMRVGCRRCVFRRMGRCWPPWVWIKPCACGKLCLDLNSFKMTAVKTCTS
jgi:hypothetical protein